MYDTKAYSKMMKEAQLQKEARKILHGIVNVHRIVKIGGILHLCG